MDKDGKRRLGLLNAMSDVVEFIATNEAAEGHVFDSLREVLLSFGLNPESRLLGVLEELRTDRAALVEFGVLFEKWLDLNVIALSNRVKTGRTFREGVYGCDREFVAHMTTIRNTDAQVLIDKAMACLGEIKEKDSTLYELLTVGYRGWYFEDNWLDGVGGDNNSLIRNRIATLKSNSDKLEWLYDHLEDNRSKRSLNALIASWLTFSMQDALALSIYCKQSVVNTDIFPLYEDEVFVDCGSYIGDTVADYVNAFNRGYKRVYAYDISEPTVEIMKEQLKALDNIVYNVKGVGEEAGELSLAGVDAPFHGNRLVAEGGLMTIPVVKLDDDITEPITFLKIDVEGLDKEALRGAREQIVKNHPKLHVDTYHKLADVFAVPLLIHKIDPTYKYYLRILNSVESPMQFAVTCIYAI